MSFIRFNKVPKHQKFNYVPRFWDEAKEDLDARVRIAKGDKADAELAKARIQSGFKRRSRAGSTTASRSSTLRLLAIIAILLMLTYLFLVSTTIQQMIEAFD